MGAGLAGLQAAVTISETDPNLRVTLADLGGGASSKIMGFCVPLTSGDSPEAFANDTLEVGGGENDSELVQCLTRKAIPTLESLSVWELNLTVSQMVHTTCCVLSDRRILVSSGCSPWNHKRQSDYCKIPGNIVEKS